MKKLMLLFLLSFLLTKVVWSQTPERANFDDDFQLGGDIFTNFDDDLESTQVMEDERFYRYSRFFSINVGLGMTTFDDTREEVFQHVPPSYHFSFMYFVSFQVTFNIGLEYSRHFFTIGNPTRATGGEALGTVISSNLRPFIGMRYYVDTSDLGTALTYSNPYVTGRIAYWYQTTEYIDSQNLSDENGGGMGTGLGFGLEFPLDIKESYLNFEFMYNFVNFYDEYTADYQATEDGDDGTDNLKGNAYSMMITYNISW